MSHVEHSLAAVPDIRGLGATGRLVGRKPLVCHLRNVLSILALAALYGAIQAGTSCDDGKARVIGEALQDIETLPRIHIAVVSHCVDTQDGDSLLIKGDGSVERRREASWLDFSISEAGKAEILRKALLPGEVVALGRLFTRDDVLGLGKRDDIERHQRRLSVSIAIDGTVIHEFECGDFLPPNIRRQSTRQDPARDVVDAIRATVSELEKTIEKEDAEFLSESRIRTLLQDGKENLWIELRDVGGMRRGFGMRVRLSDAGVLQAVLDSPKRENRDVEVKRFSRQTDGRVTQRVFEACCREDPFSIVRRREIGANGEGSPRLTLSAVVDGRKYVRSIWLWSREGEENLRFLRIWDLMTIVALCAESADTSALDGGSIQKGRGARTENPVRR